jgi:hypothetical protein
MLNNIVQTRLTEESRYNTDKPDLQKKKAKIILFKPDSQKKKAKTGSAKQSHSTNLREFR